MDKKEFIDKMVEFGTELLNQDIKFYKTSGTYGCFSNFSKHPVILKNKTWATSEHYYQAQKFADTEFEDEFLSIKRPSDAAARGRDRSLPLRKDWESVKDDVMEEVVYAKFTQHEDIKQTLLSTGTAKLIEHTENDHYWADGGDGSGKNMLGIILMKVRDRIKGEQSK